MVNIEKYEELPLKESRIEYLTRKYGNIYNLRNFDTYCRNRNPWSIAERILKNNINKSFSMAFHYYCTKVDKQYQYVFLNKLDNFRYWNYSGYYYIDKNDIIRYLPRSWKSYKSKQSDKEYYEKLSKERKSKRELKKYKLEKEYTFIQKDVLKEKEESLRKLISHGFDPKLSFRNH